MAKDGEPTERKDTKRVVLSQHRVILVPEGVTLEELASAADVKALKKLIGAEMPEAWVVRGEFVGDSKDKAIEAYAGKAGTDSAKIGVFKAPTASAWAGGVRHKAPPKPLVEKEAIA